MWRWLVDRLRLGAAHYDLDTRGRTFPRETAPPDPRERPPGMPPPYTPGSERIAQPPPLLLHVHEDSNDTLAEAEAQVRAREALTGEECRALRMAVIFGKPPQGHPTLDSAVEKLKLIEARAR